MDIEKMILGIIAGIFALVCFAAVGLMMVAPWWNQGRRPSPPDGVPKAPRRPK